jgi:hypothetical protein
MMGAAPRFRQDEPPGGGGIADAGEVRAAATRLPERQREALALCELEGLSYEEIAATIAMSTGAVAQLIAHGRINLYDELHGTVLASVAPSQECERALPLLAAREDGELDTGSDDAARLDAHLAGCERCRLAEEQMREAAAAYRSAPSIAVTRTAPPGDEEGLGSPDQSEEAVVKPVGAAAARGAGWRRRMTIAGASLAALLLLAGLALAVSGGRESAPVSPAAGAASERGAGQPDRGGQPADAGKRKGGAAKRGGEKRTATAGSTSPAASGGEAAEEVTSYPTFEATGGDAASGGGNPATGQKGGSGQAAVEPTRQTTASKPSSKPKPAPTSTAAPQTTPTTTAPAPPPGEAPVDGPGRSEEAPGKPAKDPKQ